MGEANETEKTVLAQASEDAMVVDTLGGRMHVRWDESAQATPHGQIAFFAEFLATPTPGPRCAHVAAVFRFNALVWLTWPAIKAHLNRLQAAQIARAGVGPERGALRDALTLFDENAALWRAPNLLVEALRRRDWHALFVTHRTQWQRASLTLVGHAPLEKLMQPRKAITAHVWVVADDAPDALLGTLTPRGLEAKPFLALPALGVPGWWPANEDPGFYADAQVFRPPRR